MENSLQKDSFCIEIQFLVYSWTSCISKNDNAFESAEEFIPNGGKFFQKLSKYDDFLADVVEKDGYKAGDTLRLIPPFFRLYGITDEEIRAYSANHILLVPGAREMLEYTQSIMPTFMISTSYKPYIDALCELIKGFSGHCFPPVV